MSTKRVLKIMAAAAVSAAGLYCLNKYINSKAVAKGLLPETAEQYTLWRGNRIYYNKKGNGSPIVLVHALDPSASAYEWSRIEDILAENHRVYTIDLPGCGRSDKPQIIYTNFYFVQLLTSFVKTIVCEKAHLVASGYSCSFALTAAVYDPAVFSGLTLINPPSLTSLAEIPDRKARICKTLLELPLIGPAIYNIMYAKQRIDDAFTEKYLFNPFLVKEEYIDTYYESAHLRNGDGRFLTASILGNYVNLNLTHPLTKLTVPASIIASTALPEEELIAGAWKKQNREIRMISMPESAALPHFEKPEETAALIEKNTAPQEEAAAQ